MQLVTKQKRVIETEKMMDIVKMGTLPINSLSEKDMSSFKILFMQMPGDYVSFVRVSGLVLGAALFSKKTNKGIPYMDIIDMKTSDIGNGKIHIIGNVLNQVELFALKNETQWVSSSKFVLDGFKTVMLMDNFKYLPVTEDDYFKPTVILSSIFKEVQEHVTGYKKKDTILQYEEGTFNYDMMDMFTQTFDRTIIKDLATRQEVPFHVWDKQFIDLGNIMSDDMRIRFTKHLHMDPLEIMSDMMKTNSIHSDKETLSQTTGRLLDIISPNVYNTNDMSKEDIHDMLGDVDDFVKVCRGELATTYIHELLEEDGLYIFTYEVGGLVLSFSAIEISKDKEFGYVHILCARPSIGLGSRMLKASEDFALQIGAREMRLGAVSPRVPWYEKQGYEKFTYEDEEDEEEDEDDEVHMRKKLIIF